jgi:hypothetical protein
MTGNLGNTGNTANTGNTGNSGSAGSSGAREWGFADRLNRPLINAQDPPGTDPLPIVLPTDKGYADRNWDAYWYSWRVLTEFAQAGWIGDGKDQIAMDPPPLDDTPSEMQDLFQLARTQRADALDEIVAQKDEFISYFMALIGASPQSRPNTHRVISAASLIALFAAMHFKAKFRRQRPSSLYPLLLPPVQVPGHASYPSGHATQSKLIALCVGGLVITKLEDASQKVIKSQLETMSTRIAFNREIGGLHYHSDSENGRTLAGSIYEKLSADIKQPDAQKKVPSFAAAVAAAMTEWT